MNGSEHTGAHDEGAEQAQGEAGQGQQQRPTLEDAPLFRDCQGMHQRRGRQPRHEGGVLHRIPKPPAAPAQFVVGPPTAQGDPQREESPSHIRPRTRPPRPGAVQPPGQQRRHGKGEGHGQAHIAGVEHGRMHDQPEVLQQGIEVRTVRRRQRQRPLKGIAGQQQETQEAAVQQPHDAQGPGQKVRRQASVPQGHSAHPQSHDERPQQQRTLMGAPNGADLVVPRQQAVRVARRVRHRKVVGQESPHERGEAQGHKHRLPEGHRHRGLHPAAAPQAGAGQAQHRAGQAQDQRNDHRQVADFRAHQAFPLRESRALPNEPCTACQPEFQLIWLCPVISAAGYSSPSGGWLFCAAASAAKGSSSGGM